MGAGKSTGNIINNNNNGDDDTIHIPQNLDLLIKIDDEVKTQRDNLLREQGKDRIMKEEIDKIKSNIQLKTEELEKNIERLQDPNIQMGGSHNKWRFVSPNTLFRKYDRKSLNSLALRWGIGKPKSYRHKKDLALVLKLLMHNKYGDVRTRNGLNQIAGNCGIKARKYKTKDSLCKKLAQVTKKISFNVKRKPTSGHRRL